MMLSNFNWDDRSFISNQRENIKNDERKYVKYDKLVITNDLQPVFTDNINITCYHCEERKHITSICFNINSLFLIEQDCLKRKKKIKKEARIMLTAN